MPDPAVTRRALVRAIYHHVYATLKGAVGIDEAYRAAQELVADMPLDVENCSWESASRMSASEAQSHNSCFRPVRISGHIIEVGDVEGTTVPIDEGGVEYVDSVCAVIHDYEGEPLKTVAVTARWQIAELRASNRSGRAVEVLGVIIPLPVRLDPRRLHQIRSGGRRGFFLLVVEVRRSTSAMDLIMATDSERNWAMETLEGLKREHVSPLDYLRDWSVARLGIVGLDEFPLMGDMVDFVVLQALSNGRVRNASARLHLLIVGPPGQGKKIPSEVARLLSLRYESLSSGNLSAPGLVGACRRTDAGWHSEPGALVRAAEGIVSLQDAHGLSLAELRRIGPVLQAVIEDGTATTSKAGGQTWDASTSMIIDLNRASHLGQTSGGREAPIATLRPLASRLDLIVEIPADPARTLRLASLIMGSMSSSVQRPSSGPDREGRLIVAALRDTHPSIDPRPVKAQADNRFNDLLDRHKALWDRHQDAGDYPIRAAVSMARIIAAGARACNRPHAEPEDVDRAVHYLDLKFQYLAGQPSSSTNYQTRQALIREEWFRQFAGRTVRPREVATLYTEETGEPINERTVRRHFETLGGRHLRGGEWSLPPGDEGVVRVSDCPLPDEGTATASVSDCPIAQEGCGDKTDGQSEAGTEDDSDEWDDLLSVLDEIDGDQSKSSSSSSSTSS